MSLDADCCGGQTHQDAASPDTWLIGTKFPPSQHRDSLRYFYQGKADTRRSRK